MADAVSKRQREETHLQDVSDQEAKRHKSSSYTHILSILEEEEDEATQDLSAIFATLQQELCSDFALFDDPSPCPASGPDPDSQTTPLSTSATTGESKGEEEEDEKVRVIKHLLEASDDELGIPQRSEDGGYDDATVDGGDGPVALGGGFWELEDEAANYYTLWQSELFM
ncbi:hypothetical protein RJ640_007839 [Escallonia rubra]|uniref:Uncharacterized protein n=1 Tax=Escallonia rubra TaxID=112253 RepID=A0AA88S226_9ASTE|nr:hypothetical protein RJ640_007839 [Escallonia rubra]